LAQSAACLRISSRLANARTAKITSAITAVATIATLAPCFGPTASRIARGRTQPNMAKRPSQTAPERNLDLPAGETIGFADAVCVGIPAMFNVWDQRYRLIKIWWYIKRHVHVIVTDPRS
jgi:hypothetical protein